MELHQYEDLLEQIDSLIEAMLDHESELYVAIEVAHQLRDEVGRVEPEDPDADE